ncbi:MAG: DUF2605 domain-containing protein [Desertifilum sp. SIO1I2]|nr:DUF2605 domain-containing protein [Desertifilum sp. SIO1I2]
MFNSNPPDPELLKSVLQPLLEDFQYWFARSRSMLETQEISFLSDTEQTNLLERVKQAQGEVSAAQMLFKATQGQVGIETATLMPWHQLVTECWQVAMRCRQEQATRIQQP